MALAGTLDPEKTAAAVVNYLRQAMDTADEVQVGNVTSSTTSGFSQEVVRCEASWRIEGELHQRRLVVRVAPTGPGLFPDYDLAQEHRIMQALAEHSQVPVPQVLFYEPDATLLGGPFLIMEHVEGRTAADDPPFTVEGWVVELSPEQQGFLYDNSLQILASVQAVDWRAAGLEDLRRPDAGDTPLERHLAYLERFARFAYEGEPTELVTAALRWLQSNRPLEPEPTVLSWGDARLANMLVADDLTINAAIDWEEATLASPELDLGYFLYVIRNYTVGIGVPRPPGFPTPQQTLQRYEELTGHKPVNIPYYERAAAVTAALVVARVASLMIEAGFIPPESSLATNNPATQLLAQMYGLPAPDGAVAAWHGQR